MSRGPLKGPGGVQGQNPGRGLGGPLEAPEPPEALGFFHLNTLKQAYFVIFFVTLSGQFFLNYLKSKPILEILRCKKSYSILFAQHYTEKPFISNKCLFDNFLYTLPSLWMMPICENHFFFAVEKMEEKKVESADRGVSERDMPLISWKMHFLNSIVWFGVYFLP